MRRVLASVTLLLSLQAWADAPARLGLTVSPVLVTLGAAQRSSAVTMTNGTTDDKVIQAEVLRWQHVNSEDQYVPAPEMLVNPPLFKLPGGAQQIVRVGLARGDVTAVGAERAYRLFLREVPQAEAGQEAAQLKLLLRLGVPVFVKPASPQPEKLKWHALREKDGIKLSLTNTSNVHVRAAEISLGPADVAAGQPAEVPAFAYVFPGETQSWVLKPEWAASQHVVTVTARTEQGQIRADLGLEDP